MTFTGEMAYRLNEDGSQTPYSEIDPEDSKELLDKKP
jgi:hypothetical protein